MHFYIESWRLVYVSLITMRFLLHNNLFDIIIKMGIKRWVRLGIRLTLRGSKCGHTDTFFVQLLKFKVLDLVDVMAWSGVVLFVILNLNDRVWAASVSGVPRKLTWLALVRMLSFESHAQCGAVFAFFVWPASCTYLDCIVEVIDLVAWLCHRRGHCVILSTELFLLVVLLESDPGRVHDRGRRDIWSVFVSRDLDVLRPILLQRARQQKFWSDYLRVDDDLIFDRQLLH